MIQTVDNAISGTLPDLNVNGLRIRSDNGSQLTSSGYEKHLRTLGIKHETIHAHTPKEDGHIKSYFGTFKDDYIYEFYFISFLHKLWITDLPSVGYGSEESPYH